VTTYMRSFVHTLLLLLVLFYWHNFPELFLVSLPCPKDLQKWNFWVLQGSDASWKVLDFFLDFPGPEKSWKISLVLESPGNESLRSWKVLQDDPG